MAYRQEETYRPTTGAYQAPRQRTGDGDGSTPLFDRAMTDRERPLFGRRRYVETKSAFKTTELFVLAAGVAAILVAATQTEEIDAWRAWLLVTILGAAYMISRGIAKAGKGAWQDD